jgi:TRAP-type mannitol/chloroaromatic compound transport system substrate-binding protein
MDRREFLSSTAAAAALAACPMASGEAQAAAAEAAPAAPAIVSGLQELRVALPWADAVSGPAADAEQFARAIALVTGERFRLRFVRTVHSGLRALAIGEADAYFGSEHDHCALDPAFGFFAGLPADAGLHGQDLAGWLTVAGGQELWDELAAAHGVKAMLVGHTGPAPGLWSRLPLDGLATLEGSRICAPGLAREVVRGLGAEAVDLAPEAIGPALARGDLLAAEWGAALHSHATGIAPAARHRYGPGINAAGNALSFGLRRCIWERMSGAEQIAITHAAAAHFHLRLAEARAQEPLLARAIAPAIANHPLPDDLLAAISAVADAVVAHAAASSAHARRINRSYMAFRAAIAGDARAVA